jgi:hypothetical protein
VDLDALRSLVTDLNFEVLGIAATITFDLENPVASRIIWMRNLSEDVPIGKSYSALGARRVMAIKRNGFSEIPRGTIVTAPEKLGSAATDWQVDGTEEVTRSHFVVSVVPETGLV